MTSYNNPGNADSPRCPGKCVIENPIHLFPQSATFLEYPIGSIGWGADQDEGTYPTTNHYNLKYLRHSYNLATVTFIIE